MSNLHKQINLGQRQRGMSAIGVIALLVVIAVIALTAVRIVPIYLENLTVRSVLEAIQTDHRVDAKSKSAIWKSIQKRLYINEVKTIRKEQVSISRENGKTHVTIEYESRRPYLGPLFIGGSFTESVVIDR